jgi:hypothetical protein
MPIVEPTWHEQHTANRELLDSCLLLAARWPLAYGTPAWHALPDGHPDRHAATLAAAEAWLAWWQPAAVATRQAALDDRIDRAVAARLRAASHDLSAEARRLGCSNDPFTGKTWQAIQRIRYPWLFDPNWRCHHHQRHGVCAACAAPAATLIDPARKDHAA